MRLLLIVNPFASSVSPRTTVLVQQALASAAEVSVVETKRRGHATRFAQDAASRGVDVVAALGGDGTLNEVANGLAGTATALATLPGGSTNVFARTIGLPNDPLTAAPLMAAAITEQRVHRAGLGVVNGRYFLFHTGVGFDAAVVAAVERKASMKRWVSHPLFIWAGLRTWAGGYDRRRPHFRVTLPNGDTVPDGYFAICMNTDPYTFLGNRPLSITSAATLDRGLVLVTFRTLRPGAIAGALSSALRGKGLGSSAVVDERVDLTEATVEAIDDTRPFPYQVDGDHLGDSRRLAFAHAPEALRLVLPAPAA